MEMPKPVHGHRRLQELEGQWVGEENMHPSIWDPQGGLAVGRNSQKLTLNGFALISDYQQERGGAVTFSGHGVYTYDPEADLYSLHWFDCMGTRPEVFSGRFEGDILVLAHGGPGMHARMTYDLSTPGEMRSQMEMSPDGENWQTLFDAVYRRV